MDETVNKNEKQIIFSWKWREHMLAKIFVDFKLGTVTVTNFTEDMAFRPFGPISRPVWHDWENLLKSRCWDKNYVDLPNALQNLGLTEYKPLAIVLRTSGRVAGSGFSLEVDSIRQNNTEETCTGYCRKWYDEKHWYKQDFHIANAGVEMVASCIADATNLKHVQYDAKKDENDRILSVSPWMARPDQWEYLSFRSLSRTLTPEIREQAVAYLKKQADEKKITLNCAQKMLLFWTWICENVYCTGPKTGEELSRIMEFTAFMKNTDLHAGNIGILANFDTGKRIIAPAFDLGAALGEPILGQLTGSSETVQKEKTDEYSASRALAIDNEASLPEIMNAGGPFFGSCLSFPDTIEISRSVWKDLLKCYNRRTVNAIRQQTLYALEQHQAEYQYKYSIAKLPKLPKIFDRTGKD